MANGVLSNIALVFRPGPLVPSHDPGARRTARASVASEPRDRSAPAQRRARARVGESEGRSPSDNVKMRGEWSRYYAYPDLHDLEVLHARFIEHRFARHAHDYFVVGSVEQGVQAYTYRGVRRVTPAGHVFLVNPGESHTGEAAAADGYVVPHDVSADHADGAGGVGMYRKASPALVRGRGPLRPRAEPDANEVSSRGDSGRLAAGDRIRASLRSGAIDRPLQRARVCLTVGPERASGRHARARGPSTSTLQGT